MLTNDPFYWGSIRKVIIAFGSLFSDIHFVRTNLNTSPVTHQTIKVPLSYGPKEKWMIRNKQNPMPGQDDSVEMTLPRMAFQATGFVYDSPRKLTSTGRHVKALVNDNTMLKAQFNPVPWNIGFELAVMTKSQEDALMIVEQIIPFFTPDFTITVKDIPELDLLKDINVVLNGVQHEDSWDGSFEERRTITWTFNFTAKAYLYPPVKLTKVNLATDVFYRIDGTTAQAPDALPSSRTVPDPLSATAEDIERAKDTLIDADIRVIALPTIVTLNPSESKTFDVTVLNSNDITFTAEVPHPIGTENDSYIIDAAHGQFTYTCGSGARMAQQTITVKFTSVANPLRSGTVTIVLNP